MIPVELILTNFLSHAQSVIDFNKFNIALVIGAFDNNLDQSNGAGKSAIFEAIYWVLFGKSRHRKKDGVVKRDAKHCVVEFTFYIDDQLYKVIRKRDKVLGESDIIFQQWNSAKGEYESISCDTNTATDKRIVETIGVNSEVFVNSGYLRQNDISLFAEAKPSQKKDILKALLKMEKWDAYQKKAKDHRNAFKIKIDEKKKLVVPLEEIGNELELCNTNLSELKKKIEIGNNRYAKLNSQLHSKRSNYDRIYGGDATPEDLRGLQKEYAEVKKRLKEIDKKREENNTIAKNHTITLSNLQQKIIELNSHIKAANGINIENTRQNLMAGRTKEKVLKNKVAELKKEIKLNDKCNTCDKPLTNKDKQEIQEKRKQAFNKANKDYELVKNELKRFEQIADERETKVKKAHEATLEKSKVSLKESKLQAEIDRCIADNERYDKEVKMLAARDFEREISDLKAKFDKEECERLEQEISEIEATLEKISRKKDRLNIEYGSLVSRRKELIAKEKEQKEIANELDKLQSKYAVYDKLHQYFGKDGIQSVIIENVIGELEEYSNDTLAKICNEPTALKIRTQKQNENGSWAETFDIEVTAGGRSDEFETFSGGEKFRISFALRLALSKVLSKRMGGALKFLLLDEVSSSLDDKGLTMFINIVKQLSEDIKIMVITHDEKLKESFDDILLVNKGANGSKIRQVA